MTRRAIGLVAAILSTAACGGEHAKKQTAPPSPAGKIVFGDRFDNNDHDWYAGSDQHSEDGVRRGVYRILVKVRKIAADSNYLPSPVDALTLEVSVIERRGGADDEVGVGCYTRTSTPETGYRAGIGLTDGFVGIHKLDAGKQTREIFEGDAREAVESVGATNLLRLECMRGRNGGPARIRLWVNGKQIARGKDANGFRRFDGVGFYVASSQGGTEAVFDDLVVRKLETRG